MPVSPYPSMRDPTKMVMLTVRVDAAVSGKRSRRRRLASGYSVIPSTVVTVRIPGELGWLAEVVKNLEPAIRELARYQAVVYSRDYFESTIERIVKTVEEDKEERKAFQEAEAAKTAEERLAAERVEAQPKEQQRLDAERKEAQQQVEQRWRATPKFSVPAR